MSKFPRGKRIWKNLKKLYEDYEQRRLHLLAAAISFYAIFSFTPILVIVLAIGGILFDDLSLLAEVEDFLSNQLSPEVSDFWTSQAKELGQIEGGWWAATSGILVLLYTSTRLFVYVKEAVIVIVQPSVMVEKNTYLSVLGWKERVIGVAVILASALGISLLLILKIVAETIVTNLEFLPFHEFWLSLIDYLPLLLIFVFTWTVYKMFSPKKFKRKYLVIGAAITTGLLAIAWKILQLYITYMGVSSAYGAAASIFIFLLWLYVSAQIFLIGVLLSMRIAERKSSREETQQLQD